MVKKIIAIFLSVLCLCNIAPVFGAVKSNNKKSVQRKSHKYGYVVASVVGTGVAVPSLWYLIKKIGNNLDVQTIYNICKTKTAKSIINQYFGENSKSYLQDLLFCGDSLWQYKTRFCCYLWLLLATITLKIRNSKGWVY